MNPAARIEDADPAQLVRMLEAALRWLQEEWFEPWLTDEAHSDLAVDMDVDDHRQVQRLGTPYLQERLEQVTDLVREMASDLDACRGPPGDAAARWAAVHRRPLAYVVDLYELAARRNAQVGVIVEAAGWEADPPDLLLSDRRGRVLHPLRGTATARWDPGGGRPRPRGGPAPRRCAARPGVP